MADLGRVPPRRRQVLGLGAALLGGLGTGLLAGPAGAAGPGGVAARAGTGRAAGAARAERGRSAMSAPRLGLLSDQRLRHRTVMQSFAFDERAKRVYALQVVQGGERLPGESRAYSHQERVSRGDLCLNALSIQGDPLGHMYLRGFGHGGTVAAEERPGGGVTLWTEWDAHPTSGYGRGLARFRFSDGAVLDRDDSALTTHRPLPGSTKNQFALDTHGRRLLVRYRSEGAYRYALYDLDSFLDGRYQPLTDFEQPNPQEHDYFQGMALYGNYAYQLTSSDYGPSGADAVLLTCVHLGTRRIVQQVRPAKAAGVSMCEPEGLAVMTRPSPRLCVGLASAFASVRLFTLYSTDLRRSPDVLRMGMEGR